MVVRSFLKAAIKTVPFSQYIPVVRKVHESDPKTSGEDPGVSVYYGGNVRSNNQPESLKENIQRQEKNNLHGDAIFLERYYPADGVYYNQTAFSLEDIGDEYTHEIQSESCTLVDTSCPGSSVSGPSCTFCSTPESPGQNRYIYDQNTKFDDLITNNLDVVLNGGKPTPNQELIRIVYHNKGTILSALTEQVTSRLPRMPSFFRRREDPDKESTNTLDVPFVADGCSDNNYDSGYEEDDDDEEELDHVLFELDNEIKIDIFLDSLDQETKYNLYNQLKKDLQIPDGTDYFSKNNRSSIDKLQLFLIISIRLSMTGLKLVFPLTRYMYHKFQNNEFYLFNNKNADKLVDTVLRVLNYLDNKVNSNEEIIDRISQHDYVRSEQQMEQMYQDFTSYAGEFFNPNKVVDKYIVKDDLMRRTLVDYIINRASREEKASHPTNPKYNSYYSARSKDHTPRPSTPRSTTPRPRYATPRPSMDGPGRGENSSETSSISGYKSCVSSI